MEVYWSLLLHYVHVGFVHVLPIGFDHVLFIITLFFLTTSLRGIIKQSLAFTFAHSITLFLGALNLVPIIPTIVEPFIAFTILYSAIINIIIKPVSYYSYKIMLPFLFGLIHGLGFSSAMQAVGLPKIEFLFALFSFNIGVEIAQLVVLFLLYWLIYKPFHTNKYYSVGIVYPLNAIIAIIACYMFIERIIGF